MKEHRYILEPYKGISTRYRCPVCQQKDKTFSLYIDTETGEHINANVGRCNRESKCGYHYTPKQYFEDNNIKIDKTHFKANKPKQDSQVLRPASFIPIEVFKGSLSLKAFETNHFVNYLINLFGVDVTGQLVSRYFIATSKHWEGSTIFWQIDLKGKVRTGKIMLYNEATGKRIKEPFNHIQWTHKLIKDNDYNLNQCLFGEHLLIDKTKPVAIVESEKTAIIASIYLPQFIWVAFGGLSNFSLDKCQALKGRIVVLFPDLNGFDKWNLKAKDFEAFAHFTVSDLLESKATDEERKQGLDLADYLIRFDYKDFLDAEVESIKPEPVEDVEHIEPWMCFDYTTNTLPIDEHPLNWTKEIASLEAYFTKAEITKDSIKLNQCITITNVPLFIKSHLSVVKANNGKPVFIPYLNRLRQLKTLI